MNSSKNNIKNASRKKIRISKYGSSAKSKNSKNSIRSNTIRITTNTVVMSKKSLEQLLAKALAVSKTPEEVTVMQYLLEYDAASRF